MSKLVGLVSLAAVGVFLQFSFRSDAQTAAPSAQSASEQQKICDRLSFPAQICARLERLDISNLDDPSSNPKSLAAVISPLILVDTLYQGIKSQEEQNALQLVSTNGNLTQTGSSASGSGSTNLVTKPTTTDFLSIASESGAFTDTVNGSTATVHANALGLVKYLRGVPVFGNWSESGADTLQPLNLNASLNIAQSGSTVAPTSGSATGTSLASLTSIFIPSNNATLNSFGVTYAVYRRFNPQKKADSDAWTKAVIANKSQLQSDVIAIKAALIKLVPDDFISSAPIAAALAKWHKDVAAANALPPDQQFEALANAYSTYLSAYEKALLSQPNGLSNATTFLKAENAFSDGVYALFNQARGTPLANLGYTYTPSGQKPATHGFTASFAYSFKGDPKSTSFFHLSGAQLTGNYTAVIFAAVPSGATYGRLKDYQASGEFDLPLGGTPVQPLGTFSVAGYGQYQYSPTVLNITSSNLLPGTNITIPANAQAYLGTAGWLGAVQGKFVFNLKQGLNIPVAVKWSNKTDLLQANDVRGQIGISYDFSALRSLLK